MKTSTITNKNWDDAAQAVVSNLFDRCVISQLSTPQDLLRFMKLRLDNDIWSMEGTYFDKEKTPQFSSQLWYFMASHALNILDSIGVSLNKDFVTDLLIRKHIDYGPENINKFGQIGIIVRMYDKVSRLENILLKTDNNFNKAVNVNTVKDESIIDTLIDIIGYAAIAVMYISYDDEGLKIFDYPIK